MLEIDTIQPGTVAKFTEKQFAGILENRNCIACSECGNFTRNWWSKNYDFYIVCPECDVAFKFNLKNLRVETIPALLAQNPHSP